MNQKRITLLGDGGWGTALACLLAENGHLPTLWGAFPEITEETRRARENRKFLPGVRIPPSVHLTNDLEAAFKDAQIVVFSVPVVYMRAVAGKAAEFARRSGARLMTVSKGIERDTLLRGSEVIRQVAGCGDVGLLMGPSHAEEVARRCPTTVVAAARDPQFALEIQETFMGERFRVYTSDDPAGVEIGAAVKNVIAIAAGILDGLALGDNAKSALITRGLAEIARLGVAMGADARTFAGLAGLGDLITTCISPHGRNRAVGMAIGKGKKLREILAGMEMVAEGVMTTKSVCALAARHGVDMPITAEVYQVLFEDKDPRQALADLMMRQAKPEIEPH